MKARVACALASIWAACGDQAFLGSFVDQPFGKAGSAVLELEPHDLEPIMTTLETRYRTYLALREALPFETLVLQACFLSRDSGPERLAFSVDLACALGEGATGVVVVEQRLVSSDPVEVTGIHLDYQDCVVGDLSVAGEESILETETSDGGSVRTLDLEQDGLPIAYEFRVGTSEGETVIDYQVETPSGPVQARLQSPPTTGALATVLLTGSDGTLVCQIRDTPWEMGDTAKGYCDNGAIFGIPR